MDAPFDAMLRDTIMSVTCLDLKGMREAVRCLGRYEAGEPLDEECLELIALIEMLDVAPHYDVPSRMIARMQEDAVAVLEKIQARAR